MTLFFLLFGILSLIGILYGASDPTSQEDKPTFNLGTLRSMQAVAPPTPAKPSIPSSLDSVPADILAPKNKIPES